MHFLAEEVTASPWVAGFFGISDWEEERITAEERWQTGPRGGSCHCQGTWGSSTGTGIGAKPELPQNYLRANIRDSVLWEQKAGAASNRASCFKTAACSSAWNPGSSASSWVPMPGWALGQEQSSAARLEGHDHPWKTSEIYVYKTTSSMEQKLKAHVPGIAATSAHVSPTQHLWVTQGGLAAKLGVQRTARQLS